MTDQEGVYHNTPWNVNYNPNKPMIVPVNKLATYIFKYNQQFMGQRKLFPGLDQYNRYAKVISDIIKYHKYNLYYYGKVENLGLHSVKKAVATFVCSGRNVGPYVAVVLLRSEWTISG